MSVMIQAPAPQHVEPAATPAADIPAQQDSEPHAETPEGMASEEDPGSGETASESAVAESTADPVAEVGDDKPDPKADDKSDDKPEDKADDKSRAKPKRKSAPRKAAGTKTLVVLRDGRVQFADPDSVLVIDLDEAAAPDTDVHDVVDRLTELRDALDCPGKADAVKALTDLIQEKALG